jgi:hypothetical protein
MQQMPRTGVLPPALTNATGTVKSVNFNGSKKYSKASLQQVTLGMRGSRRQMNTGESGHPKLSDGNGNGPSTECSNRSDVPVINDDEEQEEAFARMTPAQARAAKIRRDRQRAAKAVVEQRMKERASKQVDADTERAGSAMAQANTHVTQRARKREEPKLRLVHGQHFPHGFQAVEYAYGDAGTWKRASNVQYRFNVFEEHATDSQPFDPEALATECTTVPHTCCDSDGNLLWDHERVGQVCPQGDGSTACAFHEHNGFGSAGMGRSGMIAQPRLLFFFDDNVLGHCISQIYGKQPPAGINASSSSIMNTTFCRCVCV